MQLVNEIGLEEIRQYLLKWLKGRDGQPINDDDITKECLLAYAEDAEFQLGEGNPACFEIRGRDSITGNPIECHISEAGLFEVPDDIEE